MSSVKVKRDSSSKDEQILFESSYGAIKVGLSREDHDYLFDYELLC